MIALALAVALAVALGAFLVASAAAKAAAPGRTRAAMVTFGIRGPRAQATAAVAVVATEALLGIAVIAGVDAAAFAAAVLMLGFAGALAVVLARGGRGRPCACLGPGSRVSPRSIGRNLVLAAGFAAVPFLPAADPSRDTWVTAGLLTALAACAVLAVMVLALAREVAELRLAIGPQFALELDDEGPPLGAPCALAGEIAMPQGAEFALAVFTSEGCHMCRALAPAIAELGRDPLLAVGRFDEHAHAGLWHEHAIPGSPYAVVLDRGGRALAKGTFNSFGQVQGMLAAAERRREEGAVAGGR